MEITHMTYAVVAAGTTPDAPEFLPIDDGITGYLGDHIDSLFEKAGADNATPPGRFRDRDAQHLFRDLHTGTEPEFLASADALARRLIERMDGRTAEGLLVCVRAETPAHGRVAGVFKLQRVTPHGAVLRELDTGEKVLAAVKDLMDSPGQLQKSALVASSLPAGQVLCGDRLLHVARYFAEAFAIQIYCRPSDAIKAFFDAVADVAESLMSEVAAAWTAVRPGPPRDVLAELGQKVPGLTASIQADIAERLNNAPRPVALLDTRRPVKETYQAGEIAICGPIEEMRRRVRIVEDPIGKWRISVDSTERPAIHR